MRIGIGGEPVAVEKGHPPVHRRIGREPGLDRKNVLGEVAIAVRDRVEARLRSERREPWRPDMRRHQIGVGAGVERDLQEVARVEPEDRPPVGSDIADAPEPVGKAIDGGEVGGVDEVVDFSGAVALLVDRGDFDFEQEPHRRSARRGQRRGDALFDIVAQAKQTGLGGNELLLELGAPCRMGEIAGGDDADALAARPVGQMLQVQILAGRPRIFRMDVQIGVEAHRMPRWFVVRVPARFGGDATTARRRLRRDSPGE